MNNTVIKRITRKLNIYSNVQFDARNVQLSIKKANNREKKKKKCFAVRAIDESFKKKREKKRKKGKGEKEFKARPIKGEINNSIFSLSTIPYILSNFKLAQF